MRIASIGVLLPCISSPACSIKSSRCSRLKPAWPGRSSRAVSTQRTIRRLRPSICHSCQHRRTPRSLFGRASFTGSSAFIDFTLPPSSWSFLPVWSTPLHFFRAACAGQRSLFGSCPPCLNSIAPFWLSCSDGLPNGDFSETPHGWGSLR